MPSTHYTRRTGEGLMVRKNEEGITLGPQGLQQTQENTGSPCQLELKQNISWKKSQLAQLSNTGVLNTFCVWHKNHLKSTFSPILAAQSLMVPREKCCNSQYGQCTCQATLLAQLESPGRSQRLESWSSLSLLWTSQARVRGRESWSRLKGRSRDQG